MVYEEVERARARYEDRLTPEIAELFGEQGDRIVSALRQGDIAEAERRARDASIALEALALVWGTVAPPFATAAYEALEEHAQKRAPSPDLWLETVLSFLEREGGAMVTAITSTVLDDLRRILTAGVEEGLGVDAMARQLAEAWPEITLNRAVRIVRTEVIGASNWGALEGAQAAARDYGLQMEQEWLATPDARVRDSHDDAGGQRVPLGAMFSVGGYDARYPGDPNLPAAERVNCRCTVVFEPITATRSWREERDGRLRRHYEAQKARYPYWSDLVQEMADAEGLAFDTMRKIVHSAGSGRTKG